MRYLRPDELRTDDDRFIHGHDPDPATLPRNDLYHATIEYRYNLMVREFTSLLPPPARITDVGCAQGNIGLKLAERGYSVVLADRHWTMLDYGRRKREGGDVQYASTWAETLPFRSHGFDGMVAAEVIEHLTRPDDLLQECRRVLKPGGILLLTTPNAEYLMNKLPTYSKAREMRPEQLPPDESGHVFFFTLEEIRATLTGLGFEILRAYAFSTPVQSGHLKTRYLLGGVPAGIRDSMDEGLRNILPAFALRTLCHELLIAARRK